MQTNTTHSLDRRTLAAHHLVLRERWQRALNACGYDRAVILAGAASTYFLDDQAAPFRPNPHFAQWFPSSDCEHSALVLAEGEEPRLLFYSPSDYWHQPPSLPGWVEGLVVEELASLKALDDRLEALLTDRSAVIGDGLSGNLAGTSNPPALLNQLHYDRAVKTAFELDAMRAASRRAAAGHLAAADAFQAGGSEFEIHLAYLAAARQTPEELPYASIVALNDHGAVLHYQHYDRVPPSVSRSFLIDAGATAHGYAADVTRSYAAEPGPFAALIVAMDSLQQTIIGAISAGRDYLELHELAHQALGALLAEQGLLDCSGEAAFEQGITETFLPHGLGHLIGLQTHDVGGLQKDPQGTQRPPPERFAALRLTRTLTAGMVVTIEPGLYFIPQLLDALKARPEGRDVAWEKVDALRPWGGIRIEDNVHVTAAGTENLTRDAFAVVDTAGAAASETDNKIA